MQPSNAVSFAVDTSSSDTEGNVEIHSSHVGETLSFDQKLRPRPSSATGQQLALSNGESYPTPLTQSATALRLRTYNAFPASDEALTSHYSADLELSFNLWMCADGIDVLASSYARVVVDPVILSSSEKDISGPLAARIVSAWMSGHGDDVYADKIIRAVAERSAQDSILGMTKDHSMSDRKLLVDKIKVLNDMLLGYLRKPSTRPLFQQALVKSAAHFLGMLRMSTRRMIFTRKKTSTMQRKRHG
ncbi:hypothetical protein QTG54_001677 [Skeletonema marinoi]|uniref:Uncharacterized protein n=1 Tax=Skeletonema marinoi TaxID=267567 RepID=A0AAD8YJG3_9STRA|nr:hypothetical protein QTG54_001677 [Skeletonema marinoi]